MKNVKIVGVSIWIWLFGVAVCLGIGLFAYPKMKEALKPAPLEIVKKELWKNGNNEYSVKGQVFNPRKDPARNVLITFKMIETKMASDESTTKAPRGKAVTKIEYIPPGSTVDFTALCDVRAAKYGFFEIAGVEFSEDEK